MKKIIVSFIFSLVSLFSMSQLLPVDLTLKVNVDYYGVETTWYFFENPDSLTPSPLYDPGSMPGIGDTVYAGGPYVNFVQGSPAGTFYEYMSVIPGTYLLSFYDDFGDGMGFTNGSYVLFRGEDTLCYGGGNFGDWESHIVYVEPTFVENPGCMNNLACNFNPLANTDDGSCLFIGSPCVDLNELSHDDVINSNCECIGIIDILGCMDSTALNYNDSANVDNGSCVYPEPVYGCMAVNSCNYNPEATEDDGSCDFVSCVGCTDIYASNFNPDWFYSQSVVYPDMSQCLYQTPDIDATTECGMVTVMNLTFGEDGPGTLNYFNFGDGVFLDSDDDIVYHEYTSDGNYMIQMVYTQGIFITDVTDTVVIDIIEYQPTIYVSNDTMFCDYTQASTYNWYVNGNTLTTSVPYIVISEPGTYSCEVVTVSGCSATTDELIVTSVNESVLSKVIITQDFIYNVSYGENVSVVDMDGKLVISEKYSNQISISSLAPGVYIIRIGDNTRKFVKV